MRKNLQNFYNAMASGKTALGLKRKRKKTNDFVRKNWLKCLMG